MLSLHFFIWRSLYPTFFSAVVQRSQHPSAIKNSCSETVNATAGCSRDRTFIAVELFSVPSNLHLFFRFFLHFHRDSQIRGHIAGTSAPHPIRWCLPSFLSRGESIVFFKCLLQQIQCHTTRVIPTAEGCTVAVCCPNTYRK